MDQAGMIEHARDAVERLEAALAAWRARHSQSDPGAAAEAREIRSELQKWKTVLRILRSQNSTASE